MSLPENLIKLLTKRQKSDLQRALTQLCKEHEIKKLYLQDKDSNELWKELVLRVCGLPKKLPKEKTLGRPKEEIFQAIQDIDTWMEFDDLTAPDKATTRKDAFKAIGPTIPVNKKKAHKNGKPESVAEGIYKEYKSTLYPELLKRHHRERMRPLTPEEEEWEALNFKAAQLFLKEVHKLGGIDKLNRSQWKELEDSCKEKVFKGRKR